MHLDGAVRHEGQLAEGGKLLEGRVVVRRLRRERRLVVKKVARPQFLMLNVAFLNTKCCRRPLYWPGPGV